MKKIKKMKDACAVVALCYVSGIDEETVLRVCRACGFVVGEGMADTEWLEAADDLGIRRRRVSVSPCRLRKFIHDHRIGLFLVETHDHLLCVDWGVIFDPREKERGKYPGLGRIVQRAWRVNKPLST